MINLKKIINETIEEVVNSKYYVVFATDSGKQVPYIYTSYGDNSMTLARDTAKKMWTNLKKDGHKVIGYKIIGEKQFINLQNQRLLHSLFSL